MVYRVVGHSKKATNQMAAIIKMRVSCCLHANSFLFIIARQNIYRRGVVPGGAMAPPDFGRSVNPISTTRGTDYAHLITTGTPRIFRPSDGPVTVELTEGSPYTNIGWTPAEFFVDETSRNTPQPHCTGRVYVSTLNFK